MIQRGGLATLSPKKNIIYYNILAYIGVADG